MFLLIRFSSELYHICGRIAGALPLKHKETYMQANMRGRKTLVAGAALVIASATLAACGGDSGGGDADTKDITVWTSMDTAVVDGLKSKTVAMAEEQGINLKWERVDDINKVLLPAIQSGSAPEIAIVPQPGVVKTIVETGEARSLDGVMDAANTDSLLPGLLDAGTVDGEQYAQVVSMNVKSLVFYNKVAWEKAGYPIPANLEELDALVDQIKADGGTPWCIGIESGGATGWPATDWFEDLIMRVGSPEEYTQWVNHEIPFDSDLVREAAAKFEEYMFTPGNVPGGRKSIPSTAFGDAGKPLFNKDGPGCWMLKQGSFIVSPDFLGEAANDADANVGVFGFPPATTGGDNPVLGGGDLAVLLSDADAAKDVMNIIGSAEAGVEAAPSSSFLSPHSGFDASLYPSDTARSFSDVATGASVILFDGSDAMPGEVGAGTFWSQITAWVSDSQDLDTTLKNIDESWPTS
jgi:alpha-glucoside transport system substrate-binding protein